MKRDKARIEANKDEESGRLDKPRAIVGLLTLIPVAYAIGYAIQHEVLGALGSFFALLFMFDYVLLAKRIWRGEVKFLNRK